MLKEMMVILLAIASIFLIVNASKTRTESSKMKDLKVYVPFVFSKQIDPRKVYTVGDQMISDHLYAFHYNATLEHKVLPVFSEIKIDYSTNRVELTKKRDLKDSSGKEISYLEVCESIKSSLQGTQHTNYSFLTESISCTESNIVIQMSKIPINFEYWFRSSDFSVFRLGDLPVLSDSYKPTTGPYKIKSLDSKKVILSRNHFYPAELVANEVENVILQGYSNSELPDLFSDESHIDLAYLYGYSLNDTLIKKIKSHNYKVQIFPNEWLVYLGFQKSVDKKIRNHIGFLIDSARKELEGNIVHGSLAYSVTPSDRPYGLSAKDYEANKLNQVEHEKGEFKRLRLSTLDEWSSVPLFAELIKILKDNYNIEFNAFPRSEMSKIYSEEYTDFYISPMGISSADPLGNFMFMHSNNKLFSQNISKDSISDAYSLNGIDDFNNKIKIIEKEILSNRVVIPIGHFPGVIIESHNMLRDDSKAWDWGIQAWTYKTI